jgi:hypothetical protein
VQVLLRKQRTRIKLIGCVQVKERLKKSKQDKAALRAADTKRGGGKAAKTVPGARAPGAKAGTRR